MAPVAPAAHARLHGPLEPSRLPVLFPALDFGHLLLASWYLGELSRMATAQAHQQTATCAANVWFARARMALWWRGEAGTLGGGSLAW